MISVSLEWPILNNRDDNITLIGNLNEDAHFSFSEDSISPRSIQSSKLNSPNHGAREVLYPDEDMSPLSLSLSSESIDESVGDCGICYKSLPIHSNHVFTDCGHLFCVKCIFNWNNTSSKCPRCRKILYENIANLDNHDTSHVIWPDNIVSSSDISNETYENLNDVIEWTDDPYEGDMLIDDISQIERTQLKNFRISSLDIYRRKLYIDSLDTDKIFTKQLTYSFIPRNNYIYLNVGLEHLYEFVIRKNTWDDNMDEINFLGHILEFNVNYSDDDDDEENLLVIVLYPQFIDQCYDQDTNTITFVRLNFKFSNVRRMYTICPIYEQ